MQVGNAELGTYRHLFPRSEQKAQCGVSILSLRSSTLGEQLSHGTCYAVIAITSVWRMALSDKIAYENGVVKETLDDRIHITCLTKVEKASDTVSDARGG